MSRNIARAWLTRSLLLAGVVAVLLAIGTGPSHRPLPALAASPPIPTPVRVPGPPSGSLNVTGTSNSSGAWPNYPGGTYTYTASLSEAWQITSAATVGPPSTGVTAAQLARYGITLACPCTEFIASYTATLNLNFSETTTAVWPTDCGTVTEVIDNSSTVTNQASPVYAVWAYSTASPASQTTSYYSLSLDAGSSNSVPSTMVTKSTVNSCGSQSVSGPTTTNNGLDPALCPSSKSGCLASPSTAPIGPVSGRTPSPVAVGCAVGFSTATCSGTPPPQNWNFSYDWNLPGAYKIGVYSVGLHGAVKFTWPNGFSETYGKYAAGNYQDGISGAFATTGLVSAVRRDDSGRNWDWSINYPVTDNAFVAALLYAQDDENLGQYNLEYGNCIVWAQAVAAVAHIVLPDFTDYHAPLVGPTNAVLRIPDGFGVSAALQSIYTTAGATYQGSIVNHSDGSTIGNAPDPPAPADAGSGGPLAQAALADPSGTAAIYAFAYHKATLTAAAVTTGQPFSLTVTPSGDASSMTTTAIDWGDGSPPEYSLQDDPATQGPRVHTHTYSAAGTYQDKVIVVEDGTLAEWDGSVNVGAEGSGSQSLTVPTPDPFVAYTFPSGPGVATPALSAVADGPNGSEVAFFGRSPTGELWMQETSGGSFSTGWVQLLVGGVASRPAAVKTGSNLYVFFRAATNELHYIERTGSTWSNEQNLGGIITGDPAVAVDGSGTLIVGVLNWQGNVFVNRLPSGGSWSGYQSLDGILSGRLALAGYNGDVYLFGVNPGGVLWERQWNHATSTWASWTSLDGALSSAPAATAYGSSLYVFAVNPGGVLFYRALNGGAWGTWTALDGVLSGDPAVAATSGTLLALGTNPVGALFDRRSAGGTWGAWDPLDGALASGPAAAAVGAQVYVFGINSAGNTWYRVWNGGSFGAWQNLGGILATE